MLGESITLVGDVLSIVVLDLVLSGDNALVIGLAARRLSPDARRLAIILGGAGAIGLRVVFATGAALLLSIPFLQAVGGVLLLWIAWKILYQDTSTHEVADGRSLFDAMQTIVLADVVMSLDNVLAIAGVSHGNVLQLAMGLVLSMPIILSGSGLIAAITGRVPWLSLVGAGILTWTAQDMIGNDTLIGRIPAIDALSGPFIAGALTVAITLPWLWRAARSRRANSRGIPPSPPSGL
jgi:YjbE family integral membrane protein